VAEIQGKAFKQSQRNPVSRLLHAMSDKDTIAGWNLDLNRILHVFNVRSVIVSLLLLTLCFQTELALNTHLTVSDILHGVASTQNTVSDTHDIVYNTHSIVSNIHRTMAKHQEGTGDTNRRLVSNRSTAFIAERSTNPRCCPDSS
jgi:hypothetical protein